MEQNTSKFTQLSVAESKRRYKHAPFLDDDLLFYNQFQEGDELPPFFTQLNGVILVLCLQGNLSYSIEGIRYNLKKNDLLVINDRQMISDYSCAINSKFISLIGSRMFFQEIMADFRELALIFLFVRNNPLMHLSPEGAERFRGYYNSIQNKMKNMEHRFRRSVIISLFKAMIFDMGNEVWSEIIETGNNVQPRAERIFKEFIGLVEVNFHTQRRVSWYAEQIGISSKYLSETIKAVTKDTPNKWIDHYVVMEICNLLRNTTMNIKEITDKMTFPNQSFLGKYFKEHTGMSPSEYRQSI